MWFQQKAGPWAVELALLGFTAGTAQVEERPEMLGSAPHVSAGEQEAAGSLWVGWGPGGQATDLSRERVSCPEAGLHTPGLFKSLPELLPLNFIYLFMRFKNSSQIHMA